MEKKPYVQPETKVVEVDDVEIICTSTQTDAFELPLGTGYEEDTW